MSWGRRPLGEALLAPTRIYVKPVLGCLRALPGVVHAHGPHHGRRHHREPEPRAARHARRASIDAGRVAGARRHSNCWLRRPPACPDEEARKTFNMGIGMILLVDPAQVDAVLDNLRAAGEDPVIVGKTVPGTGIVQYA